MSIATIPANTLDFQGGNNIRIAIAGLALCKFPTPASPPSPTSTIRFLRHILRHKLKMTILKKLTSGEIVEERNYFIRRNLKTITISGAELTNGFEHKPSSYREYELKKLVDLQYLHGHPLVPNTTPPAEAPTVMTVDNCLFYTAEVTKDKFDFVREDNSEIIAEQRFCEVLGGYMKVAQAKELIITIPGLHVSPIRLPVIINAVEYQYEIQFNNSCFKENGEECSETTASGTDFPKYYDLLKDEKDPKEKFDVKRVEGLRKAPDTGACLPAGEEPCLNCG